MNAAALDPVAPSELDTRLRGVRELLERSQFEAALRAGEALRADVPENRDVLYMIAVAQRYLQRIPEALDTLARLEQLYPEYPRLFQERGHCHVARRAAAPAIEAFERAVMLNPFLPASWHALRVLYGMGGPKDRVLHAQRNIATLANLPPEILTASSMFNDGEIRSAEALVRNYLLTHGDHIEGMRLLAQIGMRLDVLDDAELLLENVLRMQPDYDAARAELERLLRTDSHNRVYRTTFATVLTGIGDYERAVPLYRQVLRETPQDAEVHMSVAHALKTTGELQQAVEAYREAVRVRPECGEAYWSLANLKTYRFSEEELARMRAAEALPGIRPADGFHLCFALGKALEDRGEYAESFAYYERGNRLKKTACRYRSGITERNLRLQKAVCTAEFFAARSGFGSDSRAPILIVGLPRSGSTLIEQILASHSQVEGTMELADIPRLVQELQGREEEGGEPRYPGVLAELSVEECRRLGEKYLADTRIYRRGKAFFIDKMPNNFRHLGLIHLILPNARVLDARREPLACCFSNFKQLFASGQEFTYSLDDIGRYYRAYVELMAHWDRVLPGKVLRVQHEELVGDLESQVRCM